MKPGPLPVTKIVIRKNVRSIFGKLPMGATFLAQFLKPCDKKILRGHFFGRSPRGSTYFWHSPKNKISGPPPVINNEQSL